MFDLNAAAYSCVCSIIQMLNSNCGFFICLNRSGNLSKSASSPTQRSESIVCARVLYFSIGIFLFVLLTFKKLFAVTQVGVDENICFTEWAVLFVVRRNVQNTET